MRSTPLASHNSQFLARVLRSCAPNSIPKPQIKPLIALLVDKLADSVASVRDSATAALGAIMRVRRTEIVLQ